MKSGAGGRLTSHESIDITNHEELDNASAESAVPEAARVVEGLLVRAARDADMVVDRKRSGGAHGGRAGLGGRIPIEALTAAFSH